jgi:acyl homoserine lactone synthase
MNLVTGTSTNLRKSLVTGMGNYRHRVFVQKLGWQLQCESKLEYDEFDRDDTVYVIATDAQNSVIGTARLLPTIRPYLLQEVFPQLMGDLPLPRSEDVWELSRFAAVDFKSTSTSTSAARQFSSPTAVGLLRESLRCAARLGATRVVTVSPLGIERLLQRNGFRAHRAAPPVIVDGNPLFACWIDCR